MSEKPRSKSARLQELIHRRDKVLAVLHPPTAAHARILAGARDIDGALAEIRRWGRSSWAWGLMVYAPVGMPLDHPTLEPLYAAAAELDLAVATWRSKWRCIAPITAGWPIIVALTRTGSAA
jgi:hypothetical protein